MSSLSPTPSSKKRDLPKAASWNPNRACRGAYDLDDDLLPAKPSVDSDLCVPDCPTKYDVDMSSDDGDMEEIPLDLAGLKPTSENFAAVVAECSRLRGDKRRLQASLYTLDAEMEEVACQCEKVVAETNSKFRRAINSLMHMDTSMHALRKESSWQARQLAKVTSERNLLQRQLEAAKCELKSLKTCSLTWVRESSQPARVQEALATPRRR